MKKVAVLIMLLLLVLSTAFLVGCEEAKSSTGEDFTTGSLVTSDDTGIVKSISKVDPTLCSVEVVCRIYDNRKVLIWAYSRFPEVGVNTEVTIDTDEPGSFYIKGYAASTGTSMTTEPAVTADPYIDPFNTDTGF